MQAASRGDLNFITCILNNAQKYNVLVNEKDSDGWNALFYTIQGELLQVANLKSKKWCHYIFPISQFANLKKEAYYGSSIKRIWVNQIGM